MNLCSKFSRLYFLIERNFQLKYGQKRNFHVVESDSSRFRFVLACPTRNLSECNVRHSNAEYFSAYCLEMNFDHTVSCRNELMRDAYHAGQTRIKNLVRKHKYISLQYISSVLCS